MSVPRPISDLGPNGSNLRTTKNPARTRGGERLGARGSSAARLRHIHNDIRAGRSRKTKIQPNADNKLTAEPLKTKSPASGRAIASIFLGERIPGVKSKWRERSVHYVTQEKRKRPPTEAAKNRTRPGVPRSPGLATGTTRAASRSVQTHFIDDRRSRFDLEQARTKEAAAHCIQLSSSPDDRKFPQFTASPRAVPFSAPP